MNSQRIHKGRFDKYHWAISEEGCPTCKSGKGYPCINLDGRTQSLAKSEVHVSRVRANGHGAL